MKRGKPGSQRSGLGGGKKKGDAGGPTFRKRKPAKKTTESRLRNIALYYLNQRGTSRANLRRVLTRRVDRALKEHDGDRAEQLGWIETLLDELERLRLIDDALYATQRARSLSRAGSGERKIRAKLQEKGLSSEHIDAAVAALDPERRHSTHPASDEDGMEERCGGETIDGGPLTADWIAACRLARKRRLGPFRNADKDFKRDRELGALARAGFSYDVARRIVEATDRDALEDVIRDAGW